jgi:uncharacterized membrane protein YtjA (UPF0391 family)
VEETRGPSKTDLPQASGWASGAGFSPASAARSGRPRLGTIAFARRSSRQSQPRKNLMTILKWALIFLVVSIIAGIFGFTGISAASADIARILFYIFVVIFVVLLILGFTIFRA